MRKQSEMVAKILHFSRNDFSFLLETIISVRPWFKLKRKFMNKKFLDKDLLRTNLYIQGLLKSKFAKYISDLVS